jgi:hypothetical protein
MGGPPPRRTPIQTIRPRPCRRPTTRAIGGRLWSTSKARRPGERRSGPLAATNPSAKIPVDLVTTSASGLDPYYAPPLCSRSPWVAAARGCRRINSVASSRTTAGRIVGMWANPCQRAKTQPRARQARQRADARHHTTAAEHESAGHGERVTPSDALPDALLQEAQQVEQGPPENFSRCRAGRRQDL